MEKCNIMGMLYPKNILLKLCQVMKFMFLLAFLGIFTLSAKVYSQDQAITIRIQNATLHDLFKNIEKQSEYRFFYNDELVGINKMVSIDVSNMPIDAILGQLLENTGLRYRRMDNNLIVVSSSALLQQSTVSGTVKDATGVTMPGVNITIKGTTHGVVTDVNGRYSINVPNTNAILVFSFVGYLTKEISVGNQTVVDLEMVEDTREIEEVVVVGYGSQKKVNLTGSVASIDAKAIENKSFRNVQQAIQGQIPGLTVVQGHGQPGNETMDMNIRGVSTFSSNAPLVIVDGQAISMANLNPQDIESVSVLKDAAAAAIYGARASGGVILVTTKKGQPGKVKISYDGYVGVQDAACFPDIVNAYDHARLFREAEYNDNPNTTTYTWSLDQIEEFRTGVRPSANRPDYLFNPAFMTQHNISVSGGTEFNTFMVSLGYLKQNGVMRNTGFERFNIRITDQFKISKKLSVDIMANFVPSQRNAPSEATYPSGPTRRIYDIIASAYRRPSALPIFTSDGQWASVTAWANRFGLASKEGGFQDRQFNRLNGSLSLNWDIIDGLKFKGSYFGKYDHTRQVDFSKRMKFISPEDLTTVHFDYNNNYMLEFNQSN